MKYLELKGLEFQTNFNLNLINLEYLEFNLCENIILTKNKYLNLKTLYLNENVNVKPKKILKLPEIEECKINSNNLNEQFNSIFDISSFNKLKQLEIETKDFLNLNLENITLEKLELYQNGDISKENEIKMIEKVLSIKSLKNIKFELNQIDINDISKIKGQNLYIIDIWINNNNNDKNDLFLYNIEKKFPNISQLTVKCFNSSKNGITLEITPNHKSKIKEFSLKLNGYSNIKFNIQPYENLEKVSLSSYREIINIKNVLPIFDDKYKIIFNSLYHLDINYLVKNGISFDILNNIYNNIDNMPNLKEFSLIC